MIELVAGLVTAVAQVFIESIAVREGRIAEPLFNAGAKAIGFGLKFFEIDEKLRVIW